MALTRSQIEHLGQMGVMAVPFSGGRILCKVLNQFKIFVSDKDESIAPHLIMHGYWESWVTTAVMNHVKEGMRCINVGANVGYYTLIMAHLAGSHSRVLAFEPSPEVLRLLRTNVELNGMAQVTIIDAAAMDKEQDVSFLEFNPIHPGGGHLSNEHTDSTYLVTSKTIDNVTAEWGIGHGKLDFMLIDAEGAEMKVILGADRAISSSRKLDILLEWNPGSYDSTKDFAELLAKKHGMSAAIIGTMGERKPVSVSQLAQISKQEMVWLSKG